MLQSNDRQFVSCSLFIDLWKLRYSLTERWFLSELVFPIRFLLEDAKAPRLSNVSWVLQPQVQSGWLTGGTEVLVNWFLVTFNFR